MFLHFGLLRNGTCSVSEGGSITYWVHKLKTCITYNLLVIYSHCAGIYSLTLTSRVGGIIPGRSFGAKFGKKCVDCVENNNSPRFTAFHTIIHHIYSLHFSDLSDRFRSGIRSCRHAGGDRFKPVIGSFFFCENSVECGEIKYFTPIHRINYFFFTAFHRIAYEQKPWMYWDGQKWGKSILN